MLLCVVGGGLAGSAAAMAAAEHGARVVLFEGSVSLQTWADGWPAVSALGGSQSVSITKLAKEGVEVRLLEPVASVGPGLTVQTPSGKMDFDSVVVATGSAPLLADFPGRSKRGVHVLDSPAAFQGLVEGSTNSSKAVVSGRGEVAMQVADRLSKSGVSVTMASSGLQLTEYSQGVRGLVVAGAAEAGVGFSPLHLRGAVGVDKVEAAMLGDTVHPCDTVAVVPDRVPSPVASPARVGAARGILVDAGMRSSRPGLFAAGDCAEYTVGRRSVAFLRSSTAVAGGRAAGRSSAGAGASFSPTGSRGCRLFGVRLAAAGLCLDDAIAAGFDAAEATASAGVGEAGAVVFETRSMRVLGIQRAGLTCAADPGFLALAVSGRVRLDELASLERAGSTDISPILEAASEGIKLCQRF